jgi:hypothetical protein
VRMRALGAARCPRIADKEGVVVGERLEADREAALKQWLLAVERASYEAQRAERRYRAVDPDNRLVARGLEREWEECGGRGHFRNLKETTLLDRDNDAQACQEGSQVPGYAE